MTKQEAIKWVDDRMCCGRGAFTENHPPNIDECWEAGRMAIEALKSVRPKGKWIDRGDYAVCSRCAGTSWQQMNGVENIPFKSKYCPECGADMRGAYNE